MKARGDDRWCTNTSMQLWLQPYPAVAPRGIPLHAELPRLLWSIILHRKDSRIEENPPVAC